MRTTKDTAALEPVLGRARPRHVLLVEDFQGDAQLTQDAFHESAVPVQVHVVGTGEEALAYLRRQAAFRDAPRPDIIILDLKLPLMSGYDLLSTLKVEDDFRRIPTIVCSGSEDPDIVQRCYDLSVSTFVVKPQDWAQYAEQIKVLASYWFTVARLPRG